MRSVQSVVFTSQSVIIQPQLKQNTDLTPPMKEIRRAMRTHLFYLIALTLILGSCGTFKKVNKSKVSETVKTDSVAHIKEKEATKTKVTETADTTVKITGSEVSGSTDLTEKPYVLEDENQVVTVALDSATGRIQVTGKVKDRTVSIKINRVTETESKRETETKVSESKEVKRETKTVDKDIKRFGIPWWVWLIIITLAGLYLGKKYLKF